MGSTSLIYLTTSTTTTRLYSPLSLHISTSLRARSGEPASDPRPSRPLSPSPGFLRPGGPQYTIPPHASVVPAWSQCCPPRRVFPGRRNRSWPRDSTGVGCVPPGFLRRSWRVPLWVGTKASR